MLAGKNPVVVNYLKAVTFGSPDWIPATVSIMPATWLKHGKAIEDVVLEHPRLFPRYRVGAYDDMSLPRQYQAGRWVDNWGTAWDNIRQGLDSLPLEAEAPLRDWERLGGYLPPDPEHDDDWEGPVDWGERGRQMEKARQEGGLASGSLSHGFMFMRLYYLRGFSNLMLDFATREPRLDRLIALVRDRAVSIVARWLGLGAEMVFGGDDMGMQTALPISPADWVRYVKPAYRAIVGPCAERKMPFYLHSDGHILEIVPHLAECGVTVINPQIRANGLEGIARVAKGRLCINLDLDRQMFPFAAAREIGDHIRGAVAALNSPRGGLMLTAECGPDVPLETVRTIVTTLEEIGAGPA